MIRVSVVARSDEIVRIEGTMDLEQRGRGYFRNNVRPGRSYFDIGFEEWRTLCGIDVADDGTVTKYPRGPGLDPNAERPAFLRDVPQP